MDVQKDRYTHIITYIHTKTKKQINKQTLWPLVRERTIPLLFIISMTGAAICVTVVVTRCKGR
jgi:hypothetical protein